MPLRLGLKRREREGEGVRERGREREKGNSDEMRDVGIMGGKGRMDGKMDKGKNKDG